MRCPNCESGVYIEDYNDTDPFECESCGALIRLVCDESGCTGAVDRHLEIVDDE